MLFIYLPRYFVRLIYYDIQTRTSILHYNVQPASDPTTKLSLFYHTGANIWIYFFLRNRKNFQKDNHP